MLGYSIWLSLFDLYKICKLLILLGFSAVASPSYFLPKFLRPVWPSRFDGAFRMSSAKSSVYKCVLYVNLLILINKITSLLCFTVLSNDKNRNHKRMKVYIAIKTYGGLNIFKFMGLISTAGDFYQ